MLAEPGAVVLVGMADEEDIHVEPALGVAVELLAEQARDIGSIIVGVVCCRPNVQIKQHLAAGLQINESHVAVADRIERKRADHGVISVGIRSHQVFAHRTTRGRF